jgi:formylglycine-generating enzyme required for sulfatase activity
MLITMLLAVVATAMPIEAKKCPVDSVQVGVACVDKYEASVWKIPAANPTGKSNAGLIRRVQKGAVTLAQLMSGGATQYGTDYSPCLGNGSGCKDEVYAVSIAGVLPARQITWFQALAACGNSLKRLPTNAEWQLAALGTPDPGTNNGTTDCNINNTSAMFSASSTGSRSDCESDWGAWDMVGNVIEHVQEWVPLSEPCGIPAWSNPTNFNDDMMCLFGADTGSGTRFPGAVVRGGRYDTGMAAREGIYAITGDIPPIGGVMHLGFRCAR